MMLVPTQVKVEKVESIKPGLRSVDGIKVIRKDAIPVKSAPTVKPIHPNILAKRLREKWLGK